MRNAVAFLFVLVGLTQTSQAAVVFSMSPTTTTVVQGATINYSVFVRSTLAAGEAVDGLEANVIATAGLFTSGSTFLLNNGAVDFSTPGQAFLSNFLAGGFTLPNTNTLFANLNLSTAGVAPGTYSLSFEAGSLSANSPTLAGLAVVDGGPVSFTVSAVPEPSSMLLLLGAVSGCFVLHRRRRFAKTDTLESIKI